MPNPQDALPLPARPNLERYKKLAKSLAKACKSADESAIGDWAERFVKPLGGGDRTIDGIEEFAKKTLSPRCRLTDAQLVIARSHGFKSWPKLAKHLAALAWRTSDVAQFEAAADAIVDGDIAKLKRLLARNPELIRMRSTREHQATLLHYTSANGVEGYRQKTPKNIVALAELLLNAGAEVDAEADVYVGGATTLGLAATSVHPEAAGVQEALLQTLLGHGAAIDHPRAGGNQNAVVMACLHNGRGEAAAFLAHRGARLTLETAAGAGRLDVVRSLTPKATKVEMNAGFRWACGYGRIDVVDYLLQEGVDIAEQPDHGQTALHMAAIGGQLEIIKLLLKHNAPLELKNRYGGTVLGQTLWSAAHGGDPELYVQIIETLIAAGANVPERHPPINKRVDEVLERHGSRPDKTLWWYGEKPRR